MNARTPLTATAAALLATLALPPSYAADNQPGDSATPAAGKAPAKGKATGMHSMIGEVEDLDKETGMLELNTAEGPLKLHFPPKSLARIKKGDELQIHLGFTPTGK